MPVKVSNPGVYIQELPSSVHTIVGVSTSSTAFVDVFKRGPENVPTRVNSMSDVERIFGGLWSYSEATYALSQYFLNGGQQAWVVRVVPDGARAATIALTDPSLKFQAANAGAWGNNLEVLASVTDAARSEFSLAVREVGRCGSTPVVLRSEVYHNLTLEPGPRHYAAVLAEESTMIVAVVDEGEPPRLNAPESDGTGGTARKVNSFPADDAEDEKSNEARFTPAAANSGADGVDGEKDKALDKQLARLLAGSPDAGIGALPEMAPEIFNLLCLPATVRMEAGDQEVVHTAAAALCKAHRAFYLADGPKDASLTAMEKAYDDMFSSLEESAAVYFPSLAIADPLAENRSRVVGPSGTIAGLYARTDAARGIWKAPAGTEAVLNGATPTVGVNDLDHGELNERGINVVRTFPVYGTVSWGARTTAGADVKASQWKYVPIRRLALHIENSVFAGTKWAVFEPNDEPLWAQIRLSVGTFMDGLFRQGAFAGNSPSDAYLVLCNHNTTTRSDIDNGIVNIVVGFAPLKPAEFVIVSIQQLARG